MNDKQGQLFEFKSEEKQWVPGGKGQLDFEGFVETKHGEFNHRTIIKGFQISASFNLTVIGAGKTLLGEDLARLFRAVSIEQKDGVKRYDDVPGDALRVLNYAMLDPYTIREPADCAGAASPGTDYDVVVTLYVPLAKPYAYDGLDFSMAADVFKLLRIKMAQEADLEVSAGTTVTLNSGTYWAVAECYEEAEVVQHGVDEVYVRDFDADDETKVNVTGRLHDLVLYSPGEEGGENLGDILDVRVKELQQEALLVDPDLTHRYERWRRSAADQGTSTRTNPFANTHGTAGVPKAVAILMTNGNKIADGPELDNIHVKTTPQTPGTGSDGHTGTLRLIARQIVPPSDKLTRAIENKFRAKAAHPKVSKASPGKSIPASKARYMPRTFTRG